MTLQSEAKEVQALLNKNGGPLAKRAAALISKLVKQLPPEKPRGQIHPDHEAIVLLYNTRLNKPQRDAKETRAFKEIQHLVTQEDLKNLKRWLKQPESKGYNSLLSPRKRSPITLMRSYVDQTELAAKWCAKNPPAKDRKATSIPEPSNWQPHAPGNLANISWHLLSRQYPDISKEISEAVKRACT